MKLNRKQLVDLAKSEEYIVRTILKVSEDSEPQVCELITIGSKLLGLLSSDGHYYNVDDALLETLANDVGNWNVYKEVSEVDFDSVSEKLTALEVERETKETENDGGEDTDSTELESTSSEAN